MMLRRGMMALVLLAGLLFGACSIPGKAKDKASNGLDKADRVVATQKDKVKKKADQLASKLVDSVTTSPEEYLSSTLDVEVASEEIVFDLDTYFVLEGERILIADLDKKRITKILENDELFDSKWNQSSEVDAEGLARSKSIFKQIDAEKKPVFVEGKQISYIAFESCCESLPWHNGYVLAVDENKSRVQIIFWDY